MSDWLPSLNSLRAFEAAARLRSFSKAADELSVTPAAVKQLVAKLEAAIGHPLLVRRSRGMELTQVGAQGLPELTIAFQQVSTAVRRMRSSGRANQLVISSDPSFASAWLVPRLHDFNRAHPEIDVLVHSSMEIVDLAAGAADIGIRFGVEGHGNLVAHRLFDEQLSALCSPRLAAGPPKLRRLQDLAHVPLLRWDLADAEWATNTRKWNLWRTWLAAADAEHVKPGSGSKFTDYNIAIQAAIAGQGFILGSRLVMRRVMDSGLLVDPFDVAIKPGIGYDLVTAPEPNKRQFVEQFVAWILKEVGDDRDLPPADGPLVGDMVG